MGWEDKLYESVLQAGKNKLNPLFEHKETKSFKGDLEHAANIIEWTIEPRFLKAPQVIDKFVRQYQILRDVFQLLCPICNSMKPEDLNCWGKSRMQLESQVLLRWRDDFQDDACPKCGSTRRELLSDGMLEAIDTTIGVVGMRSGKSVLMGIIASFIEHWIDYVGDVHSYFDVLADDPLQMSFVATTAKQAEETIYVKYRALRNNSPWFQRYIAWIKDKEMRQSTPVGMKRWTYDEEKDSEIWNGLLGVAYRSLNSNSSGLAGATRVASFLDELSRFDLTESKRSASEIVKVMMQGLKTVRGSRDRKKLLPWWGFFGAVSSPISDEDQTMQMMRQGRLFTVGSLSGPRGEGVPGQVSFHYDTSSFNPDQPIESFEADYLRDPIGAARDFGAMPAKAASPFIENEDRFRQSIDKNLVPTVIFARTEPEDKTGRKYVGAKVMDSNYDPVNTHYLHFDAGASFDTFAGCSAHGEWLPVKDPESGTLSQKWITVYDWILGIHPVLGKTINEKRTVWFDSVLEIVRTLKKRNRIGLITFDRWNSEKLIQDIRNEGIHTENRSIKTEDYMSFLRASYDGEIRFLPPRVEEPQDPRQKNDAEKAVYELLRLERSPDLKKIYNPRKGQVHGMNSDDLAQAVIGAWISVQKSVAHVTDSQSPQEVLKREHASFQSQYGAGGVSSGRIAHGRRW